MAKDKEEKGKGKASKTPEKNADEQRRSKEGNAKVEKEESSEVVERIIQDFASKNVDEQRGSIKDTFNKILYSIFQLTLTLRLKYRIDFLLLINADIVTRADIHGVNPAYAINRFYEFIRYLGEDTVKNKIENISDEKKSDIIEKIDNLLDALIDCLNLDIKTPEIMEKSLRRVEILIEDAKASIGFIISFAEGEESEKRKIIANDLKKQANDFTSRANAYKKNAQNFLKWSIGIMILMACLPRMYDWLLQPDGDVMFVSKTKGEYLYFHMALQILFSGRVLLSVALITGLFACIRFYASSNHNAIVCDQRASTLESYKALRASAKTKEESILVLQKVLDSATDHQATGFSKQGGGASDNVIGRITADLVRLLKK